MSWRPLITDEAERARYLAIADEIAVTTAAWPEPRTIDQLTDHALLRGYLDCDDELGSESLAAAVDALGGGGIGPGLHGGAARAGWAVAHLSEGDAADAVGAAVERSIAALLDGPDWPAYDLVAGLVGFGVFALERGEGRGDLAVRVLDHLERLASPQLGGHAWFTEPAQLPAWQQPRWPEGYWNLGVAHGVAGVIAMLARYLAAGVEPVRARALLDGAVRFLLAAAPSPTPGSGDGRFVSWTAPPGTEPDRAVRRVGWCYGDLGIAVALLSAADAADQPAWRAEAIAAAHLAARVPLERSGVVDPGICHGAAGAAHLFNRLHQATGLAELGDAARTWLRRAVEMPRSDDVTLVTGAPGAALVLHAACTDVAPLWDRLLLVDLSC